jgi:hypothetical protein
MEDMKKIALNIFLALTGISVISLLTVGPSTVGSVTSVVGVVGLMAFAVKDI